MISNEWISHWYIKQFFTKRDRIYQIFDSTPNPTCLEIFFDQNRPKEYLACMVQLAHPAPPKDKPETIGTGWKTESVYEQEDQTAQSLR